VALAVACAAALSACGGDSGDGSKLPRAPLYSVVHTVRLGPPVKPQSAGAGPAILAADEAATRVVGIALPSGRRRPLLNLGSRGNPVMVAPLGWSPDGRSFAAVGVDRGRGSGPVIVDLGSGRRRPLPGGVARFTSYGFAPDGRHLLVTRVRRNDLFAYDLRSGRATRLVSGLLAEPASAAWSPDGRRIAFTTGVDRGGILIADLRARSVRVLTRDGSSPAWSPDGARIAFATTRGVRAKRCSEDGCHPTTEIDVIGRDGTGRRRLTHTAGDERTPSWSPDGRRIVAALRGGTTDYEGAQGVVTFHADGSCYRPLAPAKGDYVVLGPGAWRPGALGVPRESGCDGCDVQIEGRCQPLSSGAPVDIASLSTHAAEQAIDDDPSPGELSASCRYLGIAGGRYDFYRCHVRWSDSRIVMQMAHDRRTPWYRYEILNRPEGLGYFFKARGRCNPSIPQGC
jgi:hypothetical protein